jgi:hypothetical protein
MTTSDTAIYPLTADDITALRKADSVTFHYFRGEGYIRAHLRGGFYATARVYTARQQRLFPIADSYSADRERRIDVHTSMHGYGTDSNHGWHLDRGADSNPEAFYMEHSGQYSPVWMTIANLMRAGDIIRLYWTADNNTQYVDTAGLHADELRIGIVRNGKIVHTLSVAHSLTPDNSARMVKRYGSSSR